MVSQENFTEASQRAERREKKTQDKVAAARVGVQVSLLALI